MRSWVLTFITIVTKRVKDSHYDVDQTGQVEGDAPPKRNITGEPEQSFIFCINRKQKLITWNDNSGTLVFALLLSPPFNGWIQRLTADLLLPPHLIVEVVKLLEEVIDFAALVVPLGAGEDANFGLFGQVFADVGDWKHNLLHGAVMTHDLGNRGGNNPQLRQRSDYWTGTGTDTIGLRIKIRRAVPLSELCDWHSNERRRPSRCQGQTRIQILAWGSAAEPYCAGPAGSQKL